MNLSAAGRWLLIPGAVAAGGFWLHERTPPEPPAPRQAKPAVEKPAPEIREFRRAGFELSGDAFATRSWAPPPSPAALPATTAETAPPLPFVYLGKKYEDGVWTVFLGAQDRMFIVHDQDYIDGLYHIDAIGPPELKLTYLPLKLPQVLPIGEAP